MVEAKVSPYVLPLLNDSGKTFNEVKDICINEYGIDISQNKKNRKREYTYPRQVACYLMYISNPAIRIYQMGMYLNKEHGTILHSITTVKNLIDTDINVRNEIKHIMEKYGIKNKENLRKYHRKFD